ncbi:MAG: hypothetical protein EOP84_18555 [Verrucomicrobiaceae bacterium]|nr:MAG: hypothetical protein EOP84_18555 [Verrucomicrobiaceae bacterium]
MFSLRNLLSERSAGGQRASFQNLDIHNSSQLGMTLLGSLLVLAGSSLRRSLVGFTMIMGGASLIHRHLTGSAGSPVRGSAKMGGATKPIRRESPMSQRTPGGGVPDHQGTKFVRNIIIDRPYAEVFKFVRNVENASRYVKSVESVQVLDDRRSHWIARTSDGNTTEWYLEIINEHPDSMIAWQSLQGSDLQHAGSIRFEPVGDGSSTHVKVSLEISVGESPFEHDVARILGELPEQQLNEDLSRLKFLVESGAQTLRLGHLESM